MTTSRNTGSRNTGSQTKDRRPAQPRRRSDEPGSDHRHRRRRLDDSTARDGITIIPEPSARRRRSDAEPSTASRATTTSGIDNGVVVDPRLKARRVAVLRSEGRRRLHTLIGLLAVTALGVGLLVVVDSSWLDVDAVEVEGAHRSDPAAIEAASAVALGQPLLDVDVDGAISAMMAEPWVLSAGLDRRLDGTVVLTITERTPRLALPTTTGQRVLVDETARQLGVAAEADIDPSWLVVAGIAASGELGRPAPNETLWILELQQRLGEGLRARIDQVIVDGDQLYLDLVEGGRVRFGRMEAVDDKLVSLQTMFDRVDLRCLYEVDLRVPTAPALTRISADGTVGAAIVDLQACTA